MVRGRDTVSGGGADMVWGGGDRSAKVSEFNAEGIRLLNKEEAQLPFSS